MTTIPRAKQDRMAVAQEALFAAFTVHPHSAATRANRYVSTRGSPGEVPSKGERKLCTPTTASPRIGERARHDPGAQKTPRTSSMLPCFPLAETLRPFAGARQDRRWQLLQNWYRTANSACRDGALMFGSSEAT